MCHASQIFCGARGAGAGAMLVAPRIVFASAATDRRFVFVIQRGAADGLNIVVPYADPAYATLRGALAIDPSTATKLDGTFALHPSARADRRSCTRTSRRCSCTRWRRRIATARTSTARTCSRPAAPRRTR